MIENMRNKIMVKNAHGTKTSENEKARKKKEKKKLG